MEFKPNGDLFTLWRQSDRFSENLAKIYTAEISLGLGENLVYNFMF